MPDKYKNTVIGFRRIDNLPLEADVYFENLALATLHVGLNLKKNTYNGQRIYAKNSNGEYDEYQVIGKTIKPMDGVYTISSKSIFALVEKPTGEGFGQCFGVSSGAALHSKLKNVKVIVDTTNDVATTSVSCKYISSSSTTGILIVSFIKGGITYTYDVQFDPGESSSLSHFSFKLIESINDLNLDVRVLKNKEVQIRFSPNLPINTYLVARRKIKKSSSRSDRSRPNQLSRPSSRHYSLRGVYYGCLIDKGNKGLIISVEDILKTESVYPGWFSVNISNLANWASINSNATEGVFTGQRDSIVNYKNPRRAYSKFGLQLITLDKDYLNGTGLANKNPCLCMGNMVRMKYRMWVVNATDTDTEDRYVDNEVAVD